MANRRALIDFVEGLLNLDPIQRWSPQQAAKHPFITGEKFTGPFQPPSVPTLRKSSNPTPAPSTEPTTSQTTTPSKKYGGLVQSPSSGRSHRIYSDAAAYNHQLSQHQSYTAQVQAANTVRHQPFSPGYELSQPPQASPYSARVASHSQAMRPPEQQGPWSMQPPSQPAMGQRIVSQGLPTSASHSSLRMNAPAMSAQTNPPPNSYYPSSRNRANTINQMDAIPPAIARLAHFGVPDPSGTRNLTPVLKRDDAIREWERRMAGHSRQSSLAHTSYPQLEYLQEQAELAAMNASGQGWIFPGTYGAQNPGGNGHGHAHRPSHGHSHSIGGGYQMQPGIAQSSPGGPMEYRRDYDGPSSASGSSSSRSYLPAFPPPAAVTSSPHAGFDAFDARDTNMGMMYTPLQPTQYTGPVGPGYGNGNGGHGHGGHSQRSSYSGPYHNGTPAQGGPTNNPFAPAQGQGPTSPRYQRRSGGYGA